MTFWVDEIYAELRRAKEKFPEFPDQPVEQVAVMVEEAGEALKAAMEYQWSKWPTTEQRNEITKELVQTGAMVLRCLGNLDRVAWTPPPQHSDPSDKK